MRTEGCARDDRRDEDEDRADTGRERNARLEGRRSSVVKCLSDRRRKPGSGFHRARQGLAGSLSGIRGDAGGDVERGTVGRRQDPPSTVVPSTAPSSYAVSDTALAAPAFAGGALARIRSFEMVSAAPTPAPMKANAAMSPATVP